MKAHSTIPSLVDIRSMANAELIGMFKFCAADLKRLKSIALRGADALLFSRTAELLRALKLEMGSRCLACET